MLTAYDYGFARVVDANGVDLVLVGDSLGMVVQGRDSTLPVTVEHIAYHTAAVARGLDRAMLVRYIEWLNAQRCADGRIWALTTQAAVYGALRQLLRWLERCRPDLITSIDYPFSPFPNKAAARASRSTLRTFWLVFLACHSLNKSCIGTRSLMPLAVSMLSIMAI